MGGACRFCDNCSNAHRHRAWCCGASGGGNGITYNGQYFVYRNFAVNEVLAAHQFQSFNETIIVGDSGNPVFFIIDNELVVTTTWWTAQTGPFVSDPYVYAAINSAIAALSPSGGYALTDINLAAAYENMQKLYFSPAVDASESTLGNWFQDSALSVPALELPTSAHIPVRSWAKSAQRVTGGAGVLAGL